MHQLQLALWQEGRVRSQGCGLSFFLMSDQIVVELRGELFRDTAVAQ